MKFRVEFIWWKSHKIWDIYANSLEDLVEKCHKMCDKYHALSFQVLN